MMKYKVGEIIEIRADLQVGMVYWDEYKEVNNIFTQRMAQYAGRRTKIVSHRHGQYILEIDKFHTYTDEMLISENEGASIEISKDEVLNMDVELLLNHVLKQAPRQLIEDALKKKDKQRFYDLCNFYNIGKVK